MHHTTNGSLLKKGMALLGFLLFLSFSVSAQRIAIVDVNRILENSKEYQAAQQELDQIAAKWRQDIAQEYDKIKGLYNRYQAEQVLLSDEARRQREEEIMAREKDVRDLQKNYFGPEGELFKRRQDLVRPIQDKVYKAIEDYANDRGYDLVLDKSSAAGIIFNKPDFDKTDEILQRLK